jgi:effector-binding domain-containing protein
MNLIQVPGEVVLDQMHFFYLEHYGTLIESAKTAWTDFYSNYYDKLVTNTEFKIGKLYSLYKNKPNSLYRVGFSLDSVPSTIPLGFKYENLEGGKYAAFLYLGSLTRLPQARERVFELVNELNLAFRDSFYIGNYLNDPFTIPEEEMQTQILVPII